MSGERPENIGAAEHDINTLGSDIESKISSAETQEQLEAQVNQLFEASIDSIASDENPVAFVSQIRDELITRLSYLESSEDSSLSDSELLKRYQYLTELIDNFDRLAVYALLKKLNITQIENVNVSNDMNSLPSGKITTNIQPGVFDANIELFHSLSVLAPGLSIDSTINFQTLIDACREKSLVFQPNFFNSINPFVSCESLNAFKDNLAPVLGMMNLNMNFDSRPKNLVKIINQSQIISVPSRQFAELVEQCNSKTGDLTYTPNSDSSKLGTFKIGDDDLILSGPDTDGDYLDFQIDSNFTVPNRLTRYQASRIHDAFYRLPDDERAKLKTKMFAKPQALKDYALFLTSILGQKVEIVNTGTLPGENYPRLLVTGSFNVVDYENGSRGMTGRAGASRFEIDDFRVIGSGRFEEPLSKRMSDNNPLRLLRSKTAQLEASRLRALSGVESVAANQNLETRMQTLATIVDTFGLDLDEGKLTSNDEVAILDPTQLLVQNDLDLSVGDLNTIDLNFTPGDPFFTLGSRKILFIESLQPKDLNTETFILFVASLKSQFDSNSIQIDGPNQEVYEDIAEAFHIMLQDDSPIDAVDITAEHLETLVTVLSAKYTEQMTGSLQTLSNFSQSVLEQVLRNIPFNLNDTTSTSTVDAPSAETSTLSERSGLPPFISGSFELTNLLGVEVPAYWTQTDPAETPLMLNESYLPETTSSVVTQTSPAQTATSVQKSATTDVATGTGAATPVKPAETPPLASSIIRVTSSGSGGSGSARRLAVGLRVGDRVINQLDSQQVQSAEIPVNRVASNLPVVPQASLASIRYRYLSSQTLNSTRLRNTLGESLQANFLGIKFGHLLMKDSPNQVSLRTLQAPNDNSLVSIPSGLDVSTLTQNLEGLPDLAIFENFLKLGYALSWRGESENKQYRLTKDGEHSNWFEIPKDHTQKLSPAPFISLGRNLGGIIGITNTSRLVTLINSDMTDLLILPSVSSGLYRYGENSEILYYKTEPEFRRLATEHNLNNEFGEWFNLNQTVLRTQFGADKTPLQLLEMAISNIESIKSSLTPLTLLRKVIFSSDGSRTDVLTQQRTTTLSIDALTTRINAIKRLKETSHFTNVRDNLLPQFKSTFAVAYSSTLPQLSDDYISSRTRGMSSSEVQTILSCRDANTFDYAKFSPDLHQKIRNVIIAKNMQRAAKQICLSTQSTILHLNELGVEKSDMIGDFKSFQETQFRPDLQVLQPKYLTNLESQLATLQAAQGRSVSISPAQRACISNPENIYASLSLSDVNISRVRNDFFLERTNQTKLMSKILQIDFMDSSNYPAGILKPQIQTQYRELIDLICSQNPNAARIELFSRKPSYFLQRLTPANSQKYLDVMSVLLQNRILSQKINSRSPESWISVLPVFGLLQMQDSAVSFESIPGINTPLNSHQSEILTSSPLFSLNYDRTSISQFNGKNLNPVINIPSGARLEMQVYDNQNVRVFAKTFVNGRIQKQEIADLHYTSGGRLSSSRYIRALNQVSRRVNSEFSISKNDILLTNGETKVLNTSLIGDLELMHSAYNSVTALPSLSADTRISIINSSDQSNGVYKNQARLIDGDKTYIVSFNTQGPVEIDDQTQQAFNFTDTLFSGLNARRLTQNLSYKAQTRIRFLRPHFVIGFNGLSPDVCRKYGINSEDVDTVRDFINSQQLYFLRNTNFIDLKSNPDGTITHFRIAPYGEYIALNQENIAYYNQGLGDELNSIREVFDPSFKVQREQREQQQEQERLAQQERERRELERASGVVLEVADMSPEQIQSKVIEFNNKLTEMGIADRISYDPATEFFTFRNKRYLNLMIFVKRSDSTPPQDVIQFNDTVLMPLSSYPAGSEFGGTMMVLKRNIKNVLLAYSPITSFEALPSDITNVAQIQLILESFKEERIQIGSKTVRCNPAGKAYLERIPEALRASLNINGSFVVNPDGSREYVYLSNGVKMRRQIQLPSISDSDIFRIEGLQGIRILPSLAQSLRDARMLDDDSKLGIGVEDFQALLGAVQGSVMHTYVNSNSDDFQVNQIAFSLFDFNFPSRIDAFRRKLPQAYLENLTRPLPVMIDRAQSLGSQSARVPAREYFSVSDRRSERLSGVSVHSSGAFRTTGFGNFRLSEKVSQTVMPDGFTFGLFRGYLHTKSTAETPSSLNSLATQLNPYGLVVGEYFFPRINQSTQNPRQPEYHTPPIKMSLSDAYSIEVDGKLKLNGREVCTLHNKVASNISAIRVLPDSLINRFTTNNQFTSELEGSNTVFNGEFRLVLPANLQVRKFSEDAPDLDLKDNISSVVSYDSINEYLVTQNNLQYRIKFNE